MRAKTVKRLAILIAVFVLIGGSAYPIWRLQVEKMGQGVVKQADLAMEEKDYLKAVDLYQQHLWVFDNDHEVQLKYADALLKLQRTPKHLDTALAIYKVILSQKPDREDVRRLAAEVAIELGGRRFETARTYVTTLLKSAKQDGYLEYLMGRCYENDKDAANAVKFYQAAIAHKAPQRLDASQRLAWLLRDPLWQQKESDPLIEAMVNANPDDEPVQRLAELLRDPQKRLAEADQVVDKMVQSDPENYRVYLERGRYRCQNKLKNAEDDFKKSLELDRSQPETYLGYAKLAVEKEPSGLDEARRILDDGLKVAPHTASLYLARAELERKSGRVDQFIEFLEKGVKAVQAVHEQIELRWRLAVNLAAQGDTVKLPRHIEDLKGLGVNKIYPDFLYAFYCYNKRDFEKARQVLSSIQAGTAQDPDLKANVNVLLARCHGQLHEPEKELADLKRAFDANPKDIATKVGWINGLIKWFVNRGEIDKAIKEYQRLLDLSPQIDRKQLVNLMLRRNQQRPPAQRDWPEVEVQLDELAKAEPNSVEPIVLRAKLYAAQDQQEKAWETLEAARSKFPKALEPWTAEAELLMWRKKFDEALSRLDSAPKQLSDRIELRMARATIWVVRGAPKDEVVNILNGVANDLGAFPKEQRRVPLAYLAGELTVRQDFKGAERIWLRLAEEDPEDVNPHLQLFDLALKAAVKADTDKQAEAEAKAKTDIETQIKAIERIDGTYGRFCRAKYLTWQASRSKDEVEGKQLRTEALALLAELKTRRDEWDQIPLAEADLVDQELAQVGLDEALKREKQESVIALLLRAIDLGARNPNVVRRAVLLLLSTGRSNEAIQLFNRMPAAIQLGGDLGPLVAQAAIAQNDPQAGEIIRKAEEIARKAVAAKPENFQERLWLVSILMAGKRTAEAETELKLAVAQAEGAAERWYILIDFLIQSKQLQKAEQALRDAEQKLDQSPLALAELCELMGRANEGPNTSAQAKPWFDKARQWFDKALAVRKDPKDLKVTRRLVQFLLHVKSVEAEKQLKAILAEGAGVKDTATFAWARHTLALMYISDDYRRPADALALLDMAGPKDAVANPEDRRVRAKVLLAQGTPEHRRAAIEILESLVDEKPANPDDLLLLARIGEAGGDWPQSRDQYRKLIERTTNSAGDPDRRKRQIAFLAEFTERLLQSHEPKEDRDKDLAEAQELIERLKQLQPDSLGSLNLELALCAARNDFEAAAALIRTTAERPDVISSVLPQLAVMAEKIGQFDDFKLAEEIYRKFASVPEAPFNPNQVLLIQFLAARKNFEAAAALIRTTAEHPDSNPATLPQLALLAEKIGQFKLAEEIYRKIAVVPGAPFNPNQMLWIQFLVRRDRLPEVLDHCESLRKNAAERQQVDGLCLNIFGNSSIPASPEQIHRVLGWFEEERRNGQQSTIYHIGLEVLRIQVLVRRDRLPEVLDRCESLRKNAAERQQVDGLCLEIFNNPASLVSPEQLNRVLGWFVDENRKDPKSMIYLLGLASLHERLGQYEKAEDYYRAVINGNDRNGNASNNLAWLMALRGENLNVALELINRAIKNNGPTPDYLDTRAVVYLSAGQGQRAIEDLKAAINAQITAPRYFHLAQAYLVVNDKANAKKSLDVAKTKGLPNGLHRLEMANYQKVLDELGH